MALQMYAACQEAVDASALLKNYTMVHPHRKAMQVEVLHEYLRFIVLKLQAKDTSGSPRLSPSPLVDEMWHCHLLDTESYASFCQEIGGGFIHHRLGGMADDPAAKQERLAKTTAAYEQYFGSAPPARVWATGTLVQACAVSSGRARDAAAEEEEATRKRQRSSGGGPAILPRDTNRPGDTDSGGGGVPPPAGGDDAVDIAAEPEPAEAARRIIIIKVRCDTLDTVRFRVAPTTRMRKVMEAYADLQGIPCTSVRFILDAYLVRRRDTVTSLDLDDQDEITCMLEASGC
eukprot:TRINITY_DN27168_c0_g1_i1.p1 TRINITY_DN27168_c0_g1~~TRINITY_DN27168_c0_g1_i1.p1  ORF type:complete len:289 (+),score=41.74 TRINITY_DN27168_c0_g1_i1:70-936(+)